MNGGSNHPSNPTTYTVESPHINLQNPLRQNYSFVGWFNDASYTTSVSSISTGSTGNKSFFAKWLPLNTITATVSIPGDGSLTFSPAQLSIAKDTGSKLEVSVAETAYSSYEWYFNGVKQGSTTKSITIDPDTNSISVGTHRLTLIVTDVNGLKSSGSVVIKVTN